MLAQDSVRIEYASMGLISTFEPKKEAVTPHESWVPIRLYAESGKVLN